MAERFWVYMDGEVPGCYEPADLVRLPGFSGASLVCPAEGGSERRNWQRAGLFPEIIEHMTAYDASTPPAAPAASAAAFTDAAVLSADDILNNTSHKLFRHVTELMKELENRREERSLTQSLQRALIEVKSELQAARERIRFLDDRLSLLPSLEARERHAHEEAERLKAELKALEERLRERDQNLAELRQRVQEAKIAQDNAMRGQAEAVGEQKRILQFNEDLNRQLAEKETTLARSLGVIRRLEMELSRILPEVMAGIKPEVPPVKEPPAPAKLPEIPVLPKPAPEDAPLPVEAAPAEPERKINGKAPPEPEEPVEPLGPIEPADAEAEEPLRRGRTSDEPGPAPGPAAKPVPAPWQNAVDDMVAFLKKNLPGQKPPA